MVWNINKISLVTIVILVALGGIASAEEDLENIKAKYHDEIAVFLKYNETVTIDIVDNELDIKSKIYREMFHISEQSKVLAKNQVYSSHFIGISQLEASTLIPYKKNKYKEYKVEEFKESFDESAGVFFDDSKNYNFTYPAVQKGAKTILKFTETYKDPRILSRFVFSSYLPVIHSEFTIKAHKDVKMRFHLFNNDGNIVKQSKRESGDYIIYTFEANDVEKLKVEEESPDITYYEPHLICAIDEYKSSDGKQQKVLSSLDDLHQWYRTFIDSIPPVEKDYIKPILDKILTPDMTELEKVKSIFYWVQDNIKYIAFEDGMRGFIPHSGNYVCEKRYGDCKDMSSILVDMMKEAGIKAHYTWIGTRDIPYSYREIYSPSVDNHMITTYIDGDNYYFMDATSQYAAFGQPSSMIQGKEALISLDRDKYIIKEIPVISEDKNQALDSCHFTLEGDDLIGSGSLTLGGYYKMFNNHYLIKSSEKGVDKRVESLLKKGSNKFFVEDYSIENLSDRDQPIVIQYKIRIEDYSKNIGNSIYLNPNLDKELSQNLIDIERRKTPFTSEFKSNIMFDHTFEIPENFKLDFLPENKSISNDLVDFNISYSSGEKSIRVKKEFSLMYLLLKSDQFESWNKSIKYINDASRDSAVLVKQ